MNDIAEGIGGAIEGALTGRAVEPKTGKRESDIGLAEPEECANCGATVSTTYCPQCGQKRHVHRSLAAIGHDLLHGVLHLDGKFWSTLPLLIFKPGQLTRRYIDGERARFVSPMAMFLFSVFAMFAVFQMVGLTVPSDLGGVSPAQFERAIEGQAENVDAELAEIAEKLEASDLTTEERSGLEARQTELLDQQAGLATVGALASGEGEGSATDGNLTILTEEEDGINVNLTGIEALDQGILKKWNDNPGLMLYKLQANGYKFSWLLIPLSIPFVWLVFAWKRRFKAYDHAIFVTYSLSFMSMLFITASLFLLVPSWGWIAALLLTLVPPVHLYKQLRGAYDLSRFSAFWRLMVLSTFIWVVLVLFLQALLLLGAF